MAAEVVINYTEGGYCRDCGVHRDIIGLEETHARWQADTDNIFLQYKLIIKVDLHSVSNLLKMVVDPDPEGVEYADVTRHNI